MNILIAFNDVREHCTKNKLGPTFSYIRIEDPCHMARINNYLYFARCPTITEPAQVLCPALYLLPTCVCISLSYYVKNKRIA